MSKSAVFWALAACVSDSLCWCFRSVLTMFRFLLLFSSSLLPLRHCCCCSCCSSRRRTQRQNRSQALHKLQEMVEEAWEPAKERKLRTGISKAGKEARKADKRHRSQASFFFPSPPSPTVLWCIPTALGIYQRLQIFLDDVFFYFFSMN